jgi:phosphatidate cytidylyltransferase
MPSPSFAGVNAATAPLSAPADRRNLLFRILSGAVLAPAVLALAWRGGPVFAVAIGLGAILGLREWQIIVSGRAFPIWYWGLVAVLLAYWAGGAPAGLTTLGGVALIAGLVGRSSKIRNPWLAALGLPYLGLTVLAMPWLRDTAGSWVLAAFVLLVIWASDIGGYVFGRAIGGPKLAPQISPKKTWAGLAGAVILAATAGFGVAVAFNASRPLDAMLIGAALAVIGQGGDLFESSIKRRFNLKDSGALIPGHGGMLDRVDALLWAVPAFAALVAAGAARGLLP